jgi:UDPglucose 6-dehydrogenase
MRVGFVGLGKLGLSTALAVEKSGHEVFGCDTDPNIASILESRRLPYREDNAQELLNKSNVQLKDMKTVVKEAELLFVTIQTPHLPKYEGITRLPEERVDFDYQYLIAGMKKLSAIVESLGQDRITVIVSTVLPGTIRREIKPVLCDHIKLCYNPFFIAMGTTVHDFLHPEFVLFGEDDIKAADVAEEFYKTIHDAPFFRTSLENAELIKVLYNTFISSKIAFANTVMEMCHHLPGTNPDQVTKALGLADQRIISTAYMSGGMGDGGGCHPRDNIALSHISRKLGMSYDWFENIMMQRERQTDWLVDLIEQEQNDLQVVILGTAFKAESNITTGSPALLLKALLEERGIPSLQWDPQIDDEATTPDDKPSCYFVATKHEYFIKFAFPKGSVVLDPWRYIPDQNGVSVIRIGE